jgi:uncharacterized protein (DUF427 family)
VTGYPTSITPTGHVAPVPRRIRAVLDGRTVVDTTTALYGWEWPNYPQYHVPLADVEQDVLVDERRSEARELGTGRRHGVRAEEGVREGAAWVYGDDAVEGLAGTVRFRWDALDAWFEEDEEVFVHPRSPYSRADALRSSRTVRVELGGAVLAESSSPVLVFETGLPARTYLERTSVRFEHLVPSDTVSSCPYKGRTSAWWSIRTPDGEVHPDLAWSYDFPTREMLAVAGMVAFFDERVDVFVDGVPQERPRTPFFRS